MTMPVGAGVVSKRGNAMYISKDISKAKRNFRLVKSSSSAALATDCGLAPGTSSYYRRIENYAHKIRGTDDVATIINILDEALGDTRALNGHRGMKVDPEALTKAERRIEALRIEVEQLRGLHVDPLTGTLNRSGLEQTYAREAARADRNQAPLGVALLDIDDFKSINDRHGHQAGDAVLVHLAQVIKRTVRPSDVVVRFGGEEFLFLLPDSGPEQAAKALTRLQHDLDRDALIYANSKLPITFSAGIAVHRTGETRDAVIAHADRALYQAKRAGKRRVVTAG